MIRGRVFQLVVVAALVAACAGPTASGGGETAGKLSGPELRAKLLQLQAARFPERQFVVGVESGSGPDAARAAAYREITRQLDWLPSGARGLLEGMYRVEKTSTDNEGMVHLLATLEREAASAHLRRLSLDAQRSAGSRLPECRRLLGAGELDPARRCVEQGQRELASAGELLNASRAAIGDTARRSTLENEESYAELAQRVSAGRLSRRSAMLQVWATFEGEAAVDEDLSSEFSPVLTDRGLKRVAGPISVAAAQGALTDQVTSLAGAASRAGAGYVVVGRIKARFVAEESGQFFSMADGAIRVIETAGRRVLFEVSCQDVKGGHISRRQANQKAVREAVRQLREQLGERLRVL